MSTILRKLGWMTRRARKEAELREELEFHLQEEAEEAEAAGLSKAQASAAARRALGNVALVMEDTRATWGWKWLEHLWQDLRYSVRILRRNRPFAAAAILSLALGIGANTAIFTLLNAIVFRPLPVSRPEQLVQFTNTVSLWDTGSSLRDRLYAYPEFQLFQAQSKALSGIFAGTDLGRINIGFRGKSGIAHGSAYSDNLFSVLEIAPQYGLLFVPGQGRANALTAVISDRYWRERFGADSSIVGSSVTINQIPFTVIGITPPEFSGLSVGKNPDIWVPLLALDLLKPDRSRWMDPLSTWLVIAGRLRSGYSTGQAQAELDVIHRQFVTGVIAASELGGREDVQRFTREAHLVLRPAATGLDSSLRAEYGFPLQLLMWVAAIVLLMACANIASLVLARASSRSREMAVRLSLGAGHGRLLRQLMTESMVLAAAGGILGIVVSRAGSLALLRMISTADSPLPVAVDPDWRTFAFTAAVSMLTGVLIGLLPAIRTANADPGPGVKSGGRLTGPSSHTVDRTLVVAQVALSVVLISGAGLFLRTFGKLCSVNTGYERDNVLLFSVDAKLAGYTGYRAGSVYREILRRLQAIPGLKSVSASVVRPVDDQFSLIDQVNEIDGRSLPNGSTIRVAWNAASPGYFRTVSTPLLAGRDFDWRDDESAPRVVIVSESLANRAFPNQNPIGHRLGQAAIVGIVRDSLYSGARDKPQPMLYHPLFQHGPGQEYQWGYVSFEMRYRSLSTLAEEVRREVASVDPNLPVFRVRTLAAQYQDSLVTERLLAALSTAFGVLALLLACVGLYGLLAYAVVRRTAEIGVRMALGARRGHILWLVLSESLWLALAGIALGIPFALWAAHYAKGILFGVGIADPLTIALTVALLLAVAATAGCSPARRALAVDPTAALRQD